jgi:two-component system C4-dicarboxylate transport sensor histidine kinase DctB
VHHLKNFARKDKGGFAPLDVVRVVEAAMELASHRAHNQGLTISLTGASQLPPVHGQAVRLEQVVINLLVNALDAVQTVPNPDIRVDLATSDGVVSIAVHDNGTGIDADVHDRITEPFFTTKRTGEGLGLGRAIVEELGGTLNFTAGPTGGSVFTVTLPVSDTVSRPVAEATE